MSRISDRVRAAVRDRSGGRCEYCLRRDEFSPFSFTIDHIVSQKHKGSSELDNLAWACPDCNIAKGSDVAAYDTDSRLLVALFNPRSQEWNGHFVMRQGLISGLTPTGRATVELLELNDSDRVETRRRLVELHLW